MAGGSGIVILRYETNQAKTSEKSNVFSSATGGTKTTDNAYAVHTFTSSGTFTTTTKVQQAEILIVAGGAGGAGVGPSNGGGVGGGGAGGILYVTGVTLDTGTTIIVI